MSFEAETAIDEERRGLSDPQRRSNDKTERPGGRRGLLQWDG
jgi:hypothetical protein